MSIILFVLYGLFAGIVALSSSPSQSRDVQLRLSVVGLASSKFESPERVGAPACKREDLFEEWRGGTSRSCRVGVTQTSLGGWWLTPWVGRKNKHEKVRQQRNAG